jgi:hypothetical protein
VLEPDVLKDPQRRRDELQLLADLFADALPGPAAARTLLLLLRQVVLDPRARQRLGQPPAAVLVANAAGDELLAGLLLDAPGVEGGRVDVLAEEEQLPRVEAFGPRADRAGSGV